MNFFEYLFCRLHWWFTQIIKEKDKDVVIFYTKNGLSMFHTLTIFPVYCILYVLLFDSYHIGGTLGINPFLIIFIVVAFINYLYFRKSKYPALLKKFDKIPKGQKKRKDILCIVYIATIIVVNVLVTIYFRSKNLGT